MAAQASCVHITSVSVDLSVVMRLTIESKKNYLNPWFLSRSPKESNQAAKSSQAKKMNRYTKIHLGPVPGEVILLTS